MNTKIKTTMNTKITKKRKFVSIGILCMLFPLLITLSGCTTLENFLNAFLGEENNENILIGVYEPMTGDYAEEGEKEIRGIEIANQMFSQALGKKIELLYIDTGSNLEVAQTSLEENVPKAPTAALGSYGSSFSLLGAEYFENAQIPAVAITNQNVYVTRGNEYYFRVSAVDSRQGEAIADFVLNSINTSKVATLYREDDDVAEVNITNLKNSLTESSTSETVVKDFIYEETDTDYTPYFEDIKDNGLDTIFLQATPEKAATIIKQADDNGYIFNFIGTSTWGNEDFFESVRGLSSKIYYTDITSKANTSSEHYDKFVELYKSAYPEEGEIPIETFMAFDAYVLLIDSIERSGSYLNGKAIAEAMMETVNFEGIAGTYNFDFDGNAIVPVKIMKVEKGTSTQAYLSEGLVKPITEELAEPDEEE